MEKRSKVSIGLNFIVLSVLFEYFFNVFSNMQNDDKTILFVYELVALIFAIESFILLIKGLRNLIGENKNYNFAFWWFYVTLVLTIAQIVLSAVAVGEDNTLISEISSIISSICDLTDTVLVVSICCGTVELLNKKGEKELAKLGKTIYTLYIMFMFITTIAKLVAIFGNELAMAAFIVIVLVLTLFAYFGYIVFLAKASKKLK